MKLLISLAGGLAGAISVTILHELIRKIDHSAPRLDRNNLFATSLAGDIISNTLYYSLAGTRIKKSMSAGSILGLGAGLSALTLPKKPGLDTAAVNQTLTRKLITVGLYLTGGLVAAGVMRWLEKRGNKKTEVPTIKAPREAYKPVLDITV